MDTDKKRLTIEIESDIFYAIKEYCALNKTTIKDFIVELIKTKIKK